MRPAGVRRALRLPSSEDRLRRELDEEVAFHLDQRVQELIGRGLSPNEARDEALRRFGDSDELRDYCRSIEVTHMRRMRMREWWEGWLQDLRVAVRQFTRSAGFVAIAVLTLALGIGASTSIFSVVRGVLLRPLPFPQADRVVQVWQVGSEGERMQFSDANFQDIREQSRSFAGLAQIASTGAISISGTSEPVRARGAVVSRDFFSVLGVRPIRGRLFTAEETQVNGARAVLIGHGFWQRNFGGDEAVLGRTLTSDGAPFTIVGIMPSALDFPGEAEFWIARELQAPLPSRTAHNWQVVGRLAEGVTLEQSKRDISAVARRLKAMHGDDTWMSDATAVPLQEQLVGQIAPTLMMLLAASLLLLLIACTNVVNLLVARMAAREAEIALRAALGAGRGRLVQQCLAESLILAVAAGALGLLLTVAGVRLLLVMQPENLPRLDEVRVDWQVLAFAILVSVAVAVSMGVIAAWRAARGDLREALAQSQRTQGGTISGERVRRGLVVAQVSMAVVLLVAAGLFARSLSLLLRVDPGFRPEHRVVMDITPGVERAERVRLYDELLARFRAIPGVSAAGGVSVMPLSPSAGGNGRFLILRDASESMTMQDFERVMNDPARVGDAEFRVASPGYFQSMNIPLVRGRMFEDRDDATAPHVALISASLARSRWPNEDPIGKVIQFGNMDGDLTPFTIVGIVGDVRETSLATTPRPTFYATYRQRPVGAYLFNFVLAAGAEPAPVMTSARRILRELRPDIPPRIRTIETVLNTSVADRRFVLSLVGIFGLTALVLAALGLYSVIAYLVTQREREIGIRVALGARSADIVRMVVRQGLAMVALGVVVGTIVSVFATRFIEKMLFGVRPTDPVAFLAVIGVLTLVAIVASFVPARRASHVQAMEVMRVG